MEYGHWNPRTPQARFHLSVVTITISSEQLQELGATYGDKFHVESGLLDELLLPFVSKALFDDPAICLCVRTVGWRISWPASGGELVGKEC